jgi:ABC-2 type transport system permease protein
MFLPFRYISFEAVNYYLGRSPLSAAARSAGLVFLWWLLLFVIGPVSLAGRSAENDDQRGIRVIRKFFGIYLNFAKVIIRSHLAYRSAYWAGIVGQWLSYSATFATPFIMTRSFKFVAGWNPEEILFLYAIYLLSYAIAAGFFFNPCTYLAVKIRTGEFDIALTRPLSPFSHEFCRGFNLGYVSQVTLSIAVLVIAVVRLNLRISFFWILSCIIMLFSAVFVQAAFFIFMSAFSFLLINENPFFNILNWITEFIYYPLNIYPAVPRIILFFVIPVAFMNFYPALVLLGRPSDLPLPAVLITPSVGVISFVLSIVFGIGHYRSIKAPAPEGG